MSVDVSELSIREGGEAYVHYCAGLAIVQKPEAWQGVHNIEDLDEMTPEKANDILFTAERLMIAGARNFMTASLPEGISRASTPGLLFTEVEPRLHVMLDLVCKEYKPRLKSINNAYSVVRPAPFLDRTTYQYLARGQYDRIETVRMLDDFAPSHMLEEYLADRRLSKPRRQALHRVQSV